jgi:inorganic triphosphatase YgiF
MSGSTGKIEIERKFAVGAGFTVPDLSGVPAVAAVTGPQTYHLVAIYFDTPAFDLAAAKVTLRRRTGGTDAGWHLKLPAGTARREVHAPLGAGDEPVPAELAGMVSGWTGERPLRPVARLQTARTVRRLMDGAGLVLAEVADDEVAGSVPGPGEAAADGPWRPASAWREVEVELDTGGPGILDAAGALLLAAGARPSPSASKLGQLLTAAGSLSARG